MVCTPHRPKMECLIPPKMLRNYKRDKNRVTESKSVYESYGLMIHFQLYRPFSMTATEQAYQFSFTISIVKVRARSNV